MAHFWLINAFVIISRVVLGSHYLHDCIAGFAIGLVAGYFVLQLIVSHYVFFQKNRLWFGLALVAAGLTGAVLGQFGLSWFAESADAFHLTSAVGCIAVGDHLERKLIGCVCHARNMKKAIRFVFFMFSSALICMLHLMFFGRSVISLHILVVALSFYCTLGFSWLGSIMMLFERQN